MNTSEPPLPTPAPQPSAEDKFFTTIRNFGIVRTESRWVSGSASGVARRMGVDPLLVRAVWFVLMIFSGVGIVLYAAAWALLPEERDGRIHFQELMRGKFDIAMVGIGLVLLVGLTSWTQPFGGDHMGPGGSYMSAFSWLMIGIAAFIVWRVIRSSRSHPNPPMTQPMTQPTTQPYAWVPPTEPIMPVAGPEARPMRPTRRRFAQVSGLVVAAVVGVCMIGAAVLLALHQQGAFTGPLLSTIAGGVAVVCGATLIGVGALGRRSSALGSIAILAVLVAGPSLAWDSLSAGTESPSVMAFSESSWVPLTTVDAGKGVVVTASTTTIDLTALDLPATGVTTVPIRVAGADVTIVVPQGLPVSAAISMAGGEVRWGLGPGRNESWLAGRTQFSSPEVEAGEVPRIHLDIRGAGATVRVISTIAKESA